MKYSYSMSTLIDSNKSTQKSPKHAHAERWMERIWGISLHVHMYIHMYVYTKYIPNLFHVVMLPTTGKQATNSAVCNTCLHTYVLVYVHMYFCQIYATAPCYLISYSETRPCKMQSKHSIWSNSVFLFSYLQNLLDWYIQTYVCTTFNTCVHAYA